MTPYARSRLDMLVRAISEETVCEFLKRKLFADDINIPARAWSTLNQLSIFLSGTSDARGMRQWQAAGRQVKRGAKAVYIFVPILPHTHVHADCKKVEESTTETVAETIVRSIRPHGYKAMPVFRVEDTEGKELPYHTVLKAFDPTKLPLIDIAKKLDIEVTPSLMQFAYGAYYHAKKRIQLGCDDPFVFLHELSHAVDAAIPGRKEDYAFNEIVAELSAAFLGTLYGLTPSISDTYGYIKHYSGRTHVAFTIAAAVSRVEAIYHHIESLRM